MTFHLPETELLFIGGMYFRRMTMPAGYLGVKETHEYTHASICIRGEGELVLEGKNIPFKTGDILTVEAGVAHAILTKTETVWVCAHPEEK
jgi:quercetin dioxygenase-like cupin family protein